ncbi:MAG: helix-turn-helix transcriptional regulator [Nitratireductor sp.]|uniref:helix-turn-helix domain-containing protein n=1 Tax=Nitratireductor sp. TaxID=1872084 RepID=UPI00260BE0CC|nr:helix-turn-helix transcriptional regulator [Nitratireductor sp.]MCV0352886.1 helix-turn-helix transcriptional regulator [Nitratireductor sp.]
MEIREVFAANLKSFRQAKGLSQEELAHAANLDRTYISSLERCIYAASIDVVDRIATVLEVDASRLLQKPSTGARQ